MNTQHSIKAADLEKNLDRIHEWIRAADQKISIFLAFEGVILTLLIPPSFNFFHKNLHYFSNIEIFLIASALILMAYSIIKSMIALVPRLNTKNEGKSLIYFGDIANFSLQDYKHAIAKMTNENYTEALAEQIHTSARIAMTKHVQFKDSLILFMAGLSIFVIGYLFLIISNCYGK